MLAAADPLGATSAFELSCPETNSAVQAERALYRHLQRAGYGVTHDCVDTIAALREQLAGGQAWDVVISDYWLPTMTAHDVLGMVTRLRPDLPCIIVSGTVTEEAAVDLAIIKQSGGGIRVSSEPGAGASFALSEAKVMYMSGYASSHSEIGNDSHGFIQKPFTAFRLAQAVRELLVG